MNINSDKNTVALNIDRCREFYEVYGKAMIQKEFPEYENRIAVGLVGEGSDCFGFDDEISSDHDFSVGFCMWLTDEDIQKIGKQLQTAYDRLVENVCKYSETDRFLKKRRRVTTISNFYNDILRTSCDYENVYNVNYYDISEFSLATATNGHVFRDDLGIFSSIRMKLMEHYPEEILRRKLAQEVHEFSQYAQSNYPRMMARKDQVTANLCINKAVESAMNIFYLLSGTYAPYYKWKRKALEKLQGTTELIRLLDEIAILPNQLFAWDNFVYSATNLNMSDRVTLLFEEVAREILQGLKKKGFVSGNELFLEAHVHEILNGVSDFDNKSDNRERLIKEVMTREWRQFDKVQNIGGRAACQNDYETFCIMRLSQYKTWPEELLESFLDDLKEADRKGWNLIMEKYARMMSNTDPAMYRNVENRLAPISEDREQLQEAVIKIQVGWMESFAADYPKLAGGSRSIHSKEDNIYNTSYETYLRGEISTYSQKTFIKYANFISTMLLAERNLTKEIMANTVALYGYNSLEEAEARK